MLALLWEFDYFDKYMTKIFLMDIFCFLVLVRHLKASFPTSKNPNEKVGY